MWQLLYVLGYVSLIGPPRAVHIKASAVEKGGELADQPLWVVVVAELIVRGGLFIMLGALVESTIGKAFYETYRMDLFLGALILCGLVHTTAYTLCFVLFRENIALSQRIYRFVRNMCYSVIPAFPVAAFLLIWQDMQRFRFDNPHIVEWAFLGTWSLFAVAGIVETFITRRRPRGMGEAFLERLRVATSPR